MDVSSPHPLIHSPHTILGSTIRGGRQYVCMNDEPKKIGRQQQVLHFFGEIFWILKIQLPSLSSPLYFAAYHSSRF